MKTKAIILFGLALIVGIGAVLLIHDWMNKQSAHAAQAAKSTTRVVVAKTPLAFGSVIRAENLEVIDWPSQAVPQGSFRTIKALVNNKDPRVVLRPLEVNEPVLKSKVSGFGGRASLSSVIAEGMRGATIRVNDVNGVAGFVLPGDRVDVLLTRDGKGARKSGPSANLITDVLLQNVKVLAIDQDLSESKDKPSVAKAVTLEVTANQAQKLVLGQSVGTLSLALRNGKNALAAKTPTVRIADLREGEINDKRTDPNPKKSAEKQEFDLSKIKVVRGTNESEYRVVKENNSATVPTTEKKPGRSSAAPSAFIKAPVVQKPALRNTSNNRNMPISLLENRRAL